MQYNAYDIYTYILLNKFNKQNLMNTFEQISIMS